MTEKAVEDQKGAMKEWNNRKRWYGKYFHAKIPFKHLHVKTSFQYDLFFIISCPVSLFHFLFILFHSSAGGMHLHKV